MIIQLTEKEVNIIIIFFIFATIFYFFIYGKIYDDKI